MKKGGNLLKVATSFFVPKTKPSFSKILSYVKFKQLLSIAQHILNVYIPADSIF